MTDSRGLSHKAFKRAQQLIPGGVNSPARAFGAVGGEPIFFKEGQGALIEPHKGTIDHPVQAQKN